MFSTERSLFFTDALDFGDIVNLSSLYDVCQSGVPDIPYSEVSIVNETSRMNREYFYCRVKTEKGIFRSKSVLIPLDTWTTL